MEQTETDNEAKGNGVNIAVGLLIAGLLFVFFPYDILNGLSLFGFEIRIENHSELGEFIGGITTPFLSTSAFILLYLTYKSQKKELSASRQILTRQSTITEKQLFESTFFNTLNLLNNIIQNVTFKEKPLFAEHTSYLSQYRGRECFKHLFNEYKQTYESHLNQWVTDNLFESASGENFLIPIKEGEKILSTSYKEFFDEYQAELGHYFRTLYNIIRYVKDNNSKNPKYYTNLVRAQLSTFEHLLLFYNCKSDFGTNFYPLIIEFSLLDNMPLDELLEPQHRQFYPEKAYE